MDNKVKSHGKRKGPGRGIGRVLREHKARLYIIWRCVVILLFYHD
jgi:hypothetical protein